jgi:hypothetical protein
MGGSQCAGARSVAGACAGHSRTWRGAAAGGAAADRGILLLSLSGGLGGRGRRLPRLAGRGRGHRRGDSGGTGGLGVLGLRPDAWWRHGGLRPHGICRREACPCQLEVLRPRLHHRLREPRLMLQGGRGRGRRRSHCSSRTWLGLRHGICRGRRGRHGRQSPARQQGGRMGQLAGLGLPRRGRLQRSSLANLLGGHPPGGR